MKLSGNFCQRNDFSIEVCGGGVGGAFWRTVGHMCMTLVYYCVYIFIGADRRVLKKSRSEHTVDLSEQCLRLFHRCHHSHTGLAGILSPGKCLTFVSLTILSADI